MNGRTEGTGTPSPLGTGRLRPLLVLIAVIGLVAPAFGTPWPEEAARTPAALLGELRLLSEEAHPLRFFEGEAYRPPDPSRPLVYSWNLGYPPKPLVPPVNWTQDPHGSRTWRFGLHTFLWVEPVFPPEGEWDPRVLDRALHLALDWIERNPQGADDTSEFAWSDMSVAIRGAHFAYLLREGVRRSHLDAEQAHRLYRSIHEHARFSAEPENYRSGHNHGLFQDAGLAAMARLVPLFEESASWRDLARQRFLETLRGTVNVEEGLHLEHSPTYHDLVYTLTDRLGRIADVVAETRPILERMRESGGWFVLPDDHFVQLGDTERKIVPDWMRTSSKECAGLAYFPGAGYAVVREGSSHLTTTAAYHSRGHKHLDELTFTWFEGRSRILVDSGSYAYEYDHPMRAYAVSARAHNTLTLADLFPPRVPDRARAPAWRRHLAGTRAYGSGMRGAGEGAGWFAVQATNRVLAAPDRHDRTWLYRPGHTLIVVDEVQLAREIASVRRFHFAPNFRVEAESPGRWIARNDELTLRVIDASPEPATATRIVRGHEEEPIQGVTFEKGKKIHPNSVLEFESRVHRERLVTVFQLVDDLELDTSRDLTVSVTSGDDGSLEVTFPDPGAGSRSIKIHPGERPIRIVPAHERPR